VTIATLTVPNFIATDVSPATNFTRIIFQNDFTAIGVKFGGKD
jgi:hypothetical protein